jgi:DNA uptake protein ComE-like DNA-binding protein
MLVLFFVVSAAWPGMAPVPAHAAAPSAPQQSVPIVPFEMRDLNEEESAALPPGEGRDAVAFMCVPCHGVLPAIAQRKTALGWAFVVEDMRVKGAKGSDEQAQAATRYLAKHFAAVDVNKATAEQLVEIAEFTAAEAAAIVAYRDDGHAFKSFTDVRKVPGLDPKRLAAVKPRLAYAPK